MDNMLDMLEPYYEELSLFLVTAGVAASITNFRNKVNELIDGRKLLVLGIIVIITVACLILQGRVQWN